MTKEDLASYQVVQQPALEGTYRGRRVYTTHAPSSGPVLLHVLNALDRFGIGPNVNDKVAMKEESGLWWHRVVEALKCKFSSHSSAKLDPLNWGMQLAALHEHVLGILRLGPTKRSWMKYQRRNLEMRCLPGSRM
jgi:gamma-glutamyltranspeptidase